MSRRLLAVLAIGALSLAPARAHAQVGLSIAGGLSMPSGDFKSGNNIGYKVDNGYNVAAGLNFSVPLMPLGLRVEGGYNSFKLNGSTTANNATQTVASGTINGIFSLGLPYVIGGVGYYSTAGSYNTSTTSGTLDRDNAMGFNAGVGMRFPLGVLSTFAEIRYHKMMGSDNVNSANKPAANVAFIPITFGINF